MQGAYEIRTNHVEASQPSVFSVSLVSSASQQQAPSFEPIRINYGATMSYTDSTGNLFYADAYFGDTGKYFENVR